MLAALTARALVWQGEMRPALLLAALGLSARYDLSDETHQLFVPRRIFQLMDMALGAIGAVIGMMVFPCAQIGPGVKVLTSGIMNNMTNI